MDYSVEQDGYIINHGLLVALARFAKQIAEDRESEREEAGDED